MDTQTHPQADDLSEDEVAKVRYHIENEPTDRASVGMQTAIEGAVALGFDPHPLRRAILGTHIALDVYGIGGPPENVAAGVTYFVSRTCTTSSKTQEAVSEAFYCSSGTVSRAYRDLLSAGIDRHYARITATDYYQAITDNDEMPVTAEQLDLGEIESPWIFENESAKR